MRLYLLLGLVALMTVNAEAQIVVPSSTSPDGKTALYYRHLPSKPMNEGYELYFRNTQSLLPLSENLVPDVPTDLSTDAAMDDEESDILLGGIGSHLEALRSHILWDTGFSYDVAWSPDSQWVAIEGGAHKFWRVMIYQQIAGRFQRVMLSDLQLGDYFDANKDDLHVPDLGAAATIHKLSPHDQQNVCWLGNGTLAINAYPYLLRDSDYQKLETHGLFFVLDARINPAAVTGFCK